MLRCIYVDDSPGKEGVNFRPGHLCISVCFFCISLYFCVFLLYFFLFLCVSFIFLCIYVGEDLDSPGEE